MRSCQIRLNELDKINQLIAKADSVDGDVLVKSGQYCVNGKSILGVSSLALHLGATVIYPDDAIEFEEYLKTL